MSQQIQHFEEAASVRDTWITTQLQAMNQQRSATAQLQQQLQQQQRQIDQLLQALQTSNNAAQQPTSNFTPPAPSSAPQGQGDNTPRRISPQQQALKTKLHWLKPNNNDNQPPPQ